MGKTYIADKETLDKCYAILAADGIYGFIEHMDVLSPTARIEYIGQNKDFTPISLNKDTGAMTLNSWADFPIIVANKPWMVRADGTPDYRLDENDYTKKEDGTASDVSNTSYNGGAFSWLARIYKQEYMLGNDRVVKFSMRERDGFEPDGFKDPSNNVLEGVWIPMFYGSILGADTSTPKMVSLAGLQPCYNNTTDKEHTAIANFSSRAAFLGGGIVQTITDHVCKEHELAGSIRLWKFKRIRCEPCTDQRSEAERSRRRWTVLRNKGCKVTQQDLPLHRPWNISAVDA